MPGIAKTKTDKVKRKAGKVAFIQAMTSDHSENYRDSF